MSEYFAKDKPHYWDLDSPKEAKPHENVIYEFWNENYTGERNSQNERHGNGSVEWTLDVTGQWRFEEWAHDQWFGLQNKRYDNDDKLNPDRKLTKNKIKFEGKWKNDWPTGNGKFYHNEKLFCEGDFQSGSFHGKVSFSISFQTVRFGIYNNYIKIKEYNGVETEELFLKKLKEDKKLGKFEGNFKYGLANGYGELELNDGFFYKGNWLNGYPYGKGLKGYDDGRIEDGEFGILNEKSISVLPQDYIEEKCGHLIFGSRRFANGDYEKIDKGTIIQKARKFIKDF